MRFCRVCKSTEKEFKLHSGNSKNGICKECHNEYNSQYYEWKKLELIKAYRDAVDQLTRTQKALDVAREALEFYTDRENAVKIGCMGGRAREALEKINEMMKE